MGWASFGLTLIGVIIALISWFGFHNISGLVIGAALAVVGLLFRPNVT
jgi:hypothetical protein